MVPGVSRQRLPAHLRTSFMSYNDENASPNASLSLNAATQDQHSSSPLASNSILYNIPDPTMNLGSGVSPLKHRTISLNKPLTNQQHEHRLAVPALQTRPNAPGGLLTPPSSSEALPMTPNRSQLQLAPLAQEPISPSPTRPRSARNSPAKGMQTPTRQQRSRAITPSSSRRIVSAGYLDEDSSSEDEQVEDEIQLISFTRKGPEASFLQEIKDNGWDQDLPRSPIKYTFLQPVRPEPSVRARSKSRSKTPQPPPTPQRATEEADRGDDDLSNESIKTSASTATNRSKSSRVSSRKSVGATSQRKSLSGRGSITRSSLPPPASVNIGDMTIERPSQPESPSDDPLLLTGPDGIIYTGTLPSYMDGSMRASEPVADRSHASMFYSESPSAAFNRSRSASANGHRAGLTPKGKSPARASLVSAPVGGFTLTRLAEEEEDDNSYAVGMGFDSGLADDDFGSDSDDEQDLQEDNEFADVSPSTKQQKDNLQDRTEDQESGSNLDESLEEEDDEVSQRPIPADATEVESEHEEGEQASIIQDAVLEDDVNLSEVHSDSETFIERSLLLASRAEEDDLADASTVLDASVATNPSLQDGSMIEVQEDDVVEEASLSLNQRENAQDVSVSLSSSSVQGESTNEMADVSSRITSPQPSEHEEASLSVEDVLIEDSWTNDLVEDRNAEDESLSQSPEASIIIHADFTQDDDDEDSVSKSMEAAEEELNEGNVSVVENSHIEEDKDDTHENPDDSRQEADVTEDLSGETSRQQDEAEEVRHLQRTTDGSEDESSVHAFDSVVSKPGEEAAAESADQSRSDSDAPEDSRANTDVIDESQDSRSFEQSGATADVTVDSSIDQSRGGDVDVEDDDDDASEQESVDSEEEGVESDAEQVQDDQEAADATHESSVAQEGTLEPDADISLVDETHESADVLESSRVEEEEDDSSLQSSAISSGEGTGIEIVASNSHLDDSSVSDFDDEDEEEEEEEEMSEGDEQEPDSRDRISIASSSESGDESVESPHIHTLHLRQPGVDPNHGSFMSGDVSHSQSRVLKLSQQTSTPIIEISSLDPRAAARATAILKLFHKYVDEGWLSGAELGDASGNTTATGQRMRTVMDAIRRADRAKRVDREEGGTNAAAADLTSIMMDAELSLARDGTAESESFLDSRGTSVATSIAGMGTAAVASPSTPFLPGGFRSPARPSSRLSPQKRAARPTPKSSSHKQSSREARQARLSAILQPPSPTSMDARSWTSEDWTRLDKYFVTGLKAISRRTLQDASSTHKMHKIEAYLEALLSVDLDIVSERFLDDMQIDDIRRIGEWSWQKVSYRLQALQRKYVGKVQEKYPGSVTQAHLLALEQGMDLESAERSLNGGLARRGRSADDVEEREQDASINTEDLNWSLNANTTAQTLGQDSQGEEVRRVSSKRGSGRVSFGTPYRNGAHSTPAAGLTRQGRNQTNPLERVQSQAKFDRIYPALPNKISAKGDVNATAPTRASNAMHDSTTVASSSPSNGDGVLSRTSKLISRLSGSYFGFGSPQSPAQVSVASATAVAYADDPASPSPEPAIHPSVKAKGKRKATELEPQAEDVLRSAESYRTRPKRRSDKDVADDSMASSTSSSGSSSASSLNKTAGHATRTGLDLSETTNATSFAPPTAPRAPSSKVARISSTTTSSIRGNLFTTATTTTNNNESTVYSSSTQMQNRRTLSTARQPRPSSIGFVMSSSSAPSSSNTSGRQITGSSSGVSHTPLSLLSPRTHQQAARKVNELRASREARNWKSPRPNRAITTNIHATATSVIADGPRYMDRSSDVGRSRRRMETDAHPTPTQYQSLGAAIAASVSAASTSRKRKDR